MIFFREPFFGSTQELSFLIDKIGVINDSPALRTNQMVMVLSTVSPLGKFITSPTVTKIKFVDHTHLYQNLQSSIDSSETNRLARMRLAKSKINIFGAQVLGCFAQSAYNR